MFIPPLKGLREILAEVQHGTGAALLQMPTELLEQGSEGSGERLTQR